MLLKFATRRNANGNRDFLGFDTDSKCFALSPYGWLCKGDFVQVSKTELLKIHGQVLAEGFQEIDNI